MAAGLDDYLAELLEPLGGVTTRRMFGGIGLFHDGLMFAIVIRDVLHFKTDPETRPAFEAEGCAPFSYVAGERTVELSYWRAPERLLDEPDAFLDWARTAVAVARRAEATRKAPRRPKKPTA
ncbi:TfoX/Sxy family protein [Methylobrevis albus]|uniref:TfoX/Sxy family protein n=1 Tax=Methylobrevis albus TaxID=2793297 RepID=A0A931I4P5_9HYPH|nr:TfoX/Sxy family protein [Methylobrevis albus]MBH0239165.1 TfoX/Sxy family protein [Methylobrevis albus]